MKAAVLERLPSLDVSVGDVETPKPCADELLIAVEACGICGTDLHILAGESYRPELPFVLGHEAVGRVEAVGDGVSDGWLGRRVTMTLFEGCGACELCLQGDERLCPELRSVRGVDRAWGGFAERMRVPASLALEVPAELEAAEAASLVDAGATAMNAFDALRAQERRSVAILGGGPLGLLVAELARSAGMRTAVAEPLAARRATLVDLGHAVVDDVAGLEGSFDAVVDCSGAPAAVAPGLALLEARGLFLVVGYATVPALDLAVVARRELRLRGIRSGSRRHLEDAMEVASTGVIALPPIARWPLDGINDAFEALRAGRVPGKAVVEIREREDSCRS